MAASSLVLTLLGPDSPGIVERLSRTVSSFDANWEESRMARLGGRFAGILRVTVASDRREELANALRAIEGLKLVVDDSDDASSPDAQWLKISLTGTDHPGIVRDITSALSRLDINVEELNTQCVDAAHSGDRLFRANALVQCPSALPLSEVRSALEKVALDLMVDLELTESSRDRT